MYIKTIKLDGYKRFKSLTIDLGDNPKRIIALVGPNGCGKSSVFDGLLFLNNAYNIIGNKDSRDFHYHSIEQIPSYNYQKVNVEFAEGNYYSVRERKSQNGKENTIFSYRSPYRYNSNLKIRETRAVNDIRLNNYGASLSADIDDKMESNYRRLNIRYNKYLNEHDCRPSEAKSYIIGELNKSLQECLDLCITSLGDIEDNKGTLFFSKSDYEGKEFEFNVLSSGEKEVVDILLDLYLRKDEYNDTIFLIDEPELHINTAIQRKLLIEINKLIGKNCQLWVATHSIGFLRALQEELKEECQIIEFRADVPWATTDQVLTPIQKNRNQWSEGKDKPGTAGQEKGMDAQVYNNIFGEAYPDTLFVSSGGNTELDQRSKIALAILGKVFPDLEIWVCKDRDMSSGALNNENDRKLYLDNNPKNHRVIKRWELENYLYDKEVLIRYCESKGLTFSESDYNAYVTDIYNQNLKDVTGRIKNFCNMHISINPENFKIELSHYITPDMVVYRELEECIFGRA